MNMLAIIFVSVFLLRPIIGDLIQFFQIKHLSKQSVDKIKLIAPLIEEGRIKKKRKNFFDKLLIKNAEFIKSNWDELEDTG